MLENKKEDYISNLNSDLYIQESSKECLVLTLSYAVYFNNVFQSL